MSQDRFFQNASEQSVQTKLTHYKDYLLTRIYERWRDEVQYHLVRMYSDVCSSYNLDIKNFDQFKINFIGMKSAGEFGLGDSYFDIAPNQVVVTLLPEPFCFPFNLIIKDQQLIDFRSLMNKFDKACELEAIFLKNTTRADKATSGLAFIQNPENRKVLFASSTGNPDAFLHDLFHEIKRFFRFIFRAKTQSDQFVEETEQLLTALQA